MSGIKRYKPDYYHVELGSVEPLLLEHPEGGAVLYNDHVEELTALQTQLSLAQAQIKEATQPMCGVCAGNVADAKEMNCVCGGIGTQWAELEGVRQALYDAQAELGRVTGERDSATTMFWLLIQSLGGTASIPSAILKTYDSRFAYIERRENLEDDSITFKTTLSAPQPSAEVGDG